MEDAMMCCVAFCCGRETALKLYMEALEGPGLNTALSQHGIFSFSPWCKYGYSPDPEI